MSEGPTYSPGQRDTTERGVPHDYDDGERCAVCRREADTERRFWITVERPGEPPATRWVCSSCRVGIADGWWDDSVDHGQGRGGQGGDAE